MNAKLLYILIREFFENIVNEEKRENLAKALIIGITIIFLFFTFMYYIISSPVSLILNTLGIDKNSNIGKILQDFKNECNLKDDALYEGRDIPLFFQFDKRWANYPYAGTTIKIAGCGPTSLAMVVVGLTGDTSVTPFTMANFSTKRGWAISGVGSSWELMTTGAREFGLNAEQVSTTAESIVENLSKGKVMIASMKPGTFTNGGHFIVLTGLTDYGMVKVNDSYSEKLSNMVFSPQLISDECKGAWAFSIGGENYE